MSKEIVKYDNAVNKLQLTDFNSKELDLLMAICSQLKDKGCESITISYSHLMDIIKWDKSQRISLFHNVLKSMSDKLCGVTITADVDSGESITFTLFSYFKRSLNKRELEVKVNSDFYYILNGLTKNFTRFYLTSYVSLRSKYSKLLFQQLEQRKNLKGRFWQISIDDFRYLMDISDTYSNKDIISKLLNPTIRDLKEINTYNNLTLTVLRSDKRGRPVAGFRFEW